MSGKEVELVNEKGHLYFKQIGNESIVKSNNYKDYLLKLAIDELERSKKQTELKIASIQKDLDVINKKLADLKRED